MKNIRSIFSILAFIIFALCSSFSCASSNSYNQISISPGKYNDYYHILLNLKKGDFHFSNDENEDSYTDYSDKQLIAAGGQFEIKVPKSKIPVPSPSCSGDIILRMPWTSPSSPNSDLYIKEKVKLFNSLKTKESIDVIIELNPYVKVISKSPLQLELKNCNVFFRHSKGRYIPYIKK